MAVHNYNYYDALVKLVDFSCQASKYLAETIAHFDTALLPGQMDEMHRIEHAADEQRHEIMTHLAKEFLPPIEREDIVELASKIDDIVDCIDDVMQHLFIYNVDRLLPECEDFAKHIVLCCESIQHIAKEFGNFRKSSTIRDSIIMTNKLESQGDKYYSAIMRGIFTSGMPDRSVFIWARIITSFEDCCDFCEDVSELFDSVIMRNS